MDINDDDKIELPKQAKLTNAEQAGLEFNEFEKRLASVSLGIEDKEEVVDEVIKEGVGEVVADSTGPVGKIVLKIINFGDEVEKGIREKKKEYLFTEYLKKTDNLEEEVRKIEDFISDPYGSMLYGKIIAILGDNTPNLYYIKMLSRILRKVVNTEFQQLFEEHKYAIDLIARLSPQALIILADCPQWPTYNLGRYQSDRGVITSDWVETFAIAYANGKKIVNPMMTRRMSYAIGELLRLDLIKSVIPGAKDSKGPGAVEETANNVWCVLTDLGKEILAYVDPESFDQWRDIEESRTS